MATHSTPCGNHSNSIDPENVQCKFLVIHFFLDWIYCRLCWIFRLPIKFDEKFNCNCLKWILKFSFTVWLFYFRSKSDFRTLFTGHSNIIWPNFSRLPKSTFKNGSRSGFLKKSHKLILPLLISAWYSVCDARRDIILLIWNGVLFNRFDGPNAFKMRHFMTL